MTAVTMFLKFRKGSLALVQAISNSEISTKQSRRDLVHDLKCICGTYLFYLAITVGMALFAVALDEPGMRLFTIIMPLGIIAMCLACYTLLRFHHKGHPELYKLLWATSFIERLCPAIFDTGDRNRQLKVCHEAVDAYFDNAIAKLLDAQAEQQIQPLKSRIEPLKKWKRRLSSEFETIQEVLGRPETFVERIQIVEQRIIGGQRGQNC